MSVLFTWAQLFDAFFYSSPICSNIDNSPYIGPLWTFGCLLGWHTAWEALLQWVISKQQQASLLSYLNPLWVLQFSVMIGNVSLWFVILSLISSATELNDRIGVWLEALEPWPSMSMLFANCCVKFLLTVLGLPVYIFCFPFLHSEKFSRIIAVSTGVITDNFVRMLMFPTIPMLLIIYSSLAQSEMVLGLQGLTISFLAIAVGGLSSSVGVDRLGWLVWWTFMGCFNNDRIQAALVSCNCLCFVATLRCYGTPHAVCLQSAC